jgi:hypothetical protein
MKKRGSEGVNSPQIVATRNVATIVQQPYWAPGSIRAEIYSSVLYAKSSPSFVPHFR